jgi:putative transposase
MKDVVAYVTVCHGHSERRACAMTRQPRSTQRKPSRRNPHTAIQLRMHEIAQTRVRYGYRRVHMLRREGWSVGRTWSIACIAKNVWSCADGDRAAARQR